MELRRILAMKYFKPNYEEMYSMLTRKKEKREQDRIKKAKSKKQKGYIKKREDEFSY